MEIADFIQQNALMVMGTLGVGAYLVYSEIENVKLRGTKLSVSQFTQKVNADAQLIDLRSHDEFHAGHIAGAKNIPMDELENSLGTLKKDHAVVLYCNMGVNSAKALKTLKSAGFTDLGHLRGGYAQWTNDNLPVVTKA